MLEAAGLFQRVEVGRRELREQMAKCIAEAERSRYKWCQRVVEDWRTYKTRPTTQEDGHPRPTGTDGEVGSKGGNKRRASRPMVRDPVLTTESWAHQVPGIFKEQSCV